MKLQLLATSRKKKKIRYLNLARRQELPTLLLLSTERRYFSPPLELDSFLSRVSHQTQETRKIDIYTDTRGKDRETDVTAVRNKITSSVRFYFVCGRSQRFVFFFFWHVIISPVVRNLPTISDNNRNHFLCGIYFIIIYGLFCIFW